MTTFQRSQLTLHGLQRIARAHEGERMVFTGMGLGDVMLTGNLNELTSLEGERQRFPLAGSNVSGNSFWASIRPKQIDDPEGLYVRSIGLYIADPANEDDRSFDKLYAVSTVTPSFHGAADAIAFIPHNLTNAEINYDIRLNTIISPTALVEIVGGIGNIGIATVPELGFVRSSNEPFDVGVDHGSGRMSVNGLSEEIAGIKEDIARLLEGAGSFGGDVSNVVNSPWFNPGTMLGGITWSDPTIEFEYIEIVSVLGGGEVIARIEPGVQFWQPPEGTHQFRIRAKLPSGNSTRGVLLPETTYESVYRANLMSVTIPMAAANQVVLVFDNFVKITNASGFSISGTNDTLEFLDQPDARTVRLRLSSRFFTQHGAYSLSYDPAVGNVLQNDGTPIDPITGHTIENYADYTPAIFTSAQIPQKEPATLVLVMSRPIKITDPTAFTLSGTTAKIVSIVSDGVTIEFALTEPVDHSGVESDVRLSFSGVGATDDAGQQVEAFTDRAVTNNSTNRAISIQTAEVPANNSLHLIVVMQGAVKMTTAKGWSLVSPNQERLPDLSEMEFTISDGTITFQLDVDLLLGRSFTVSYDGGGSLRAVSNNDKIMAFSHTVINNSTNTGGIPAGGSERNLAIVVHGRENQSAADVREICERVHRTVESGQVQNFNHDFFFLAPTAENPFNVPAMNGHGAVNVTHNADFGAHGKHLGFRIVSNNPHRGKNGFNQDHVVFSSMNILSMFRMNPTATNVGGYAASQMRQYVLNNVLPALQKQGIPFAESWMAEPPRHVSRHGGETNHEFDVITDRLYLPTEFEVFGLHAMSNANAETAANQGRYGFYNRDALLNGAPFRIKRSSISTATSWYLASAGSRRLTCFCIALFNGHASDSSSIALQGVAPAFCIA